MCEQPVPSVVFKARSGAIGTNLDELPTGAIPLDAADGGEVPYAFFAWTVNV
jgi:hypothetical protein